MSPTSYQLLYPAMLNAKVRRIFLKSKFSYRTLPDSTWLYQTLPAHAKLCLVLFESADSGKISRAGRVSRLRQTLAESAESAESADLDLAVHPCENLGACAVLEPGQQDGLVALAISADH